jgi:hypothetical protein
MSSERPRVAVLQSNYIPWKGYFDLIRRVDTFVFYDDVQYTKNDWRNRNRIKTAQGLQWLTIPVGTDLNRRICDVTIPDPRWQKKHLASIRQSYAKSACLEECTRLLEILYLEQEWQSLSELNQFSIRHISREWLGLTAEFRASSEFELNGDRNVRLLQLLINLNAKTYFSGPSAKSYLNELEFQRHGIKIEFINYAEYPSYQQLHPPFVHEVSIIDTLLSLGQRAKELIWQTP